MATTVVLLSLWLVGGCDVKELPKESRVELPVVDGGSERPPEVRKEVVAEPVPEPKDPKALGLLGVCPGAAGCASSEGRLYAGAAAVDVSATAYEIPNVAYFREKGFCPPPTPVAPFGLKRCGGLVDGAKEKRADCGRDGLCPGDVLRTRLTCSDKQACPDGLECQSKEGRCYLRYQKPDADGSEKDGLPDWFEDCGKDQICPCLDPKGRPSYFGKGGQCLQGHVKNDKYKGPDADGSEGNKKFDGIWMGGFESDHPLLGSHDPLWSRALVLRTGDTTVAIVSVDLVGLFRPAVEEVRKRVKAMLPAGAVDYILISSTHNHEGPDSMGQWGPRVNGLPQGTGINKAWFEVLLQGMSQSIVKGVQALKPARLFVASTGTGAKGFIRDSRDPVVIDDSLMVLQVLEDDGSDNGLPIATLLNWGNHPEVLSDINNYQTSDFPHYVREALEKGVKAKDGVKGFPALGGVGIYLQAAVGGLMTPLRVKVPDLAGNEQSRSDWDKSRALGYQLVKRAHDALKTKQRLDSPNVSFWAKRVDLRVENTLFRIVFAFGIFDRKAIGYDPELPIGPDNMPKLASEIALIRVGGMTFYSMPGELEPSMLLGGFDGAYTFGSPLIKDNNPNPPALSKAPKGPYLKSKIPGKYKFFVGLGNDQLGYILPGYNYVLAEKRPYFAEADGDHYEETNSLGPRTGPDLLAAYDELLKLITSP